MQKIWHEAQSNIAKVLTPQTYNAWIKPIRLLAVNGESVVLEVPDSFSREYIRDKYSTIINEALNSITESTFTLQFTVNDQREAIPDDVVLPAPVTKKIPSQNPDSGEPDRKTEIRSHLNPKYTFDKFVCGSGNQFAHAAAQAVANNPATNYNPLFIYGGVGLGKTHLLIAIGNQILAGNPSANICYYTSEN
jgi:chromosomal replication initiator protein